MTTGPAADELHAVAADLRQRVEALAPYEQGLLIAVDWLLGTGPLLYPGQLVRPAASYDPTDLGHVRLVSEAANAAAGRADTRTERRVAHGVADMLTSVAIGRPLPVPTAG